jgi:hypothetical protein
MEHPNHGMITRVLNALGSLAQHVVLVGGSVVDLYCDAKLSHAEVRPTKDVDLVTDAITYGDLDQFANQLYRNGFYQTAEDDVMCRFRWNDIIVDVMSTTGVGWAPSNRWIELGYPQAETVTVAGSSFRILPFPYFLATKFAAFRGRGYKDARMSHDLEDIVTVLDGQSKWAEKINQADPEVRQYLVAEFKLILQDLRLQDAILGNLPYEGQTARFKRLLEGMRSVADVQ